MSFPFQSSNIYYSLTFTLSVAKKLQLPVAPYGYAYPMFIFGWDKKEGYANHTHPVSFDY